MQITSCTTASREESTRTLCTYFYWCRWWWWRCRCWCRCWCRWWCRWLWLFLILWGEKSHLKMTRSPCRFIFIKSSKLRFGEWGITLTLLLRGYWGAWVVFLWGEKSQSFKNDQVTMQAYLFKWRLHNADTSTAKVNPLIVCGCMGYWLQKTCWPETEKFTFDTDLIWVMQKLGHALRLLP